MNFKTHAPARREGTTLQPNIHKGNVFISTDVFLGPSQTLNDERIAAYRMTSFVTAKSKPLNCKKNRQVRGPSPWGKWRRAASTCTL
jgi:hypothetical protein